MTIKEASGHTGVSQDTLRYYEKIGLIPPVPRNASGIRDYGDSDIRWIEFARCMRGAGLSIEVLTEYLRLYHQGEETLFERRELLAEQRHRLMEKIEDMQSTLDRLDNKIKRYDTVYLKDRVMVSDKGYFEE